MNAIKITPGFENNINSFYALSQYPGELVSDTTGLISDVLIQKTPSNTGGNTGKQGLLDSKKAVRDTIGHWGEAQTQKLFPYSRYMPKGAVLDLKKGNTGIESKTTKIGNASIIKLPQLATLNSSNLDIYYAFVFYRIRGGGKPSDLSQRPLPISRYLMKEHIFVFPISWVIFAVNTLPPITTVNVPFQKMHLSKVRELYNLAEEAGKGTEDAHGNFWVGN